MAKGTVISPSSHKEIWYEFDTLSGQNNKFLDIINSSAKKYTRCIENRKNEEFRDTKNIGDIDLNLPKLNFSYSTTFSKKFSKKVQKWVGIIEEIETHTFSAKVIDLTDDTTYEIGEFDINEISPDDLKLLQPGAIFYWTVGYFMDNGQISKKSEIRFQRLIKLTIEDIDEVSDDVENYYGNLL